MRQYGRIPHLPGSRAGADDRHAATALARRCVGDGHDGDRVIVTEKLDGSCVALVRQDGAIAALGREGRPCASSRNHGRRAFAAWVASQPARWAALRDGERLILEWMVLAHGVRYDLPHEPAVVIDLFDPLGRRAFAEVAARAAALRLPVATVLHDGGPCPVETALAALGPHGRHGALDPPEGVVYRVERARDGAVLAQAKYVRPDLIPGRFLADHTGGADVWNRWTGPFTVAAAAAA